MSSRTATATATTQAFQLIQTALAAAEPAPDWSWTRFCSLLPKVQTGHVAGTKYRVEVNTAIQVVFIQDVTDAPSERELLSFRIMNGNLVLMSHGNYRYGISIYEVLRKYQTPRALLRYLFQLVHDHAGGTTAAAEPRVAGTTPNQALRDLDVRVAQGAIQLTVQGFDVHVLKPSFDYLPVIRVSCARWRDTGFGPVPYVLYQSRSARQGTVPKLMESSTENHVVGDIHRGVSSWQDLLRNAVKLAIKAGEQDFKRYLATKKRTEKAQAAAEQQPVNDLHGAGLAWWGDHKIKQMEPLRFQVHGVELCAFGEPTLGRHHVSVRLGEDLSCPELRYFQRTFAKLGRFIEVTYVKHASIIHNPGVLLGRVPESLIYSVRTPRELLTRLCSIRVKNKLVLDRLLSQVKSQENP